jgi:hypothetical protein
MPGGLDDDPAILNDTRLWRRIAPWQWIQADDVPSGFRPTSEIFSDPDLSVVIADECPIEIFLHNLDGFGIAECTAGDVRDCGWGIIRKPDDKLPGHCHVTGKNKRQKLRGKLAKKCRIVREPTVKK